MFSQFIADRPTTSATERVRDPVVSPTILHCRTASAVTRRPNDPRSGLGHDATRRAGC
jgi:hypothetical protein